MDYKNIVSDEIIEKTRTELKKNGMNSIVVQNGAEAKAKVLEMIPLGAGVMTMTSETLELTGVAEEINNSGKYAAARGKLYDPAVQVLEKRWLVVGLNGQWGACMQLQKMEKL